MFKRYKKPFLKKSELPEQGTDRTEPRHVTCSCPVCNSFLKIEIPEEQVDEPVVRVLNQTTSMEILLKHPLGILSFIGIIVVSSVLISTFFFSWWAKKESAQHLPEPTSIPVSVTPVKTATVTPAPKKEPTALPATPESNAQRIRFKDASYDCYVVDCSNVDLRFVLLDDEKKPFTNFGNVERWIATQKKQLLFAMNGGMFTQDQKPLGLYIEDGKELNKINLRTGAGNFYMKPNGIFLIRNDKTAQIINSSDYKKFTVKTIRFATQSGPLMLEKGVIHKSFKPKSVNKNIRNGVGIISKQRVVFAISNELVSFYDFALLFRDQFQCAEALYLDGAISKMYVPELQRKDSEGILGPMIIISK